MSMKALVLEESGSTNNLVLKHLNIPELIDNTVLIQIHAASIHPFDIAYIHGVFGPKRDVIPGIDAAGVVVQASNAELQDLVGKRVSCFNSGTGSTGVWAEYARINRLYVMPVDDCVDFSKAAVLFNTPMATRMLAAEVQAINVPSILINAAFSSVGKMLIQYCKLINIRTLAVIRKQDQIEKLYELGADKVLNSSEPDYDRQLQESITHFSIFCALDCIGGSETEKLFHYLPDSSYLYIFGNLASTPPHINEEEAKRRGITIRFLSLPVWLRNKSYEERHAIFNSNTHEYRHIFSPAIHAEMSLSRESVEYAMQHSGSEGKVIMRPKF